MGKVENTTSVDSSRIKKGINKLKTNAKESSSIHIDAKMQSFVEKMKNTIGNDDFLTLFAGLDSKHPEKLDKEDLKILDKCDGIIGNLSQDDINIFKNAVLMHKANQENPINFKSLLSFTVQYSDISNGDFDDGLFIDQTEQTENIFKTAKIKQNNNIIEINLSDAETTHAYSSYKFNTTGNYLVEKIKHYPNNKTFAIYSTEKYQDELAQKDGIKPANKQNTYNIDNKTYKYIYKKDSFVDSENHKDIYLYDSKNKKMVSDKEAKEVVLKRLYGESYQAGYLNEKNEKLPNVTDKDISAMKNDPTSMIGEVLRFNEANSQNKDLNKIYNIETINTKLKAMLKENKIELIKDNLIEGAYSPKQKTIYLNYQNILNSDDNLLFETLYHELIHSEQQINMDARQSEQQAHFVSRSALLIKQGTFDEQNKKNLAECVKYSLNYNYLF